ncbi:MAG TPA: hypothetical protein VJB59_04245 [Bdellovibrionota bacterium]|nr:hypothetical protein [Bdellovibrionota bacterium]
MEKWKVVLAYRAAFMAMLFVALSGLAFVAGIAWSTSASAAESKADADTGDTKAPRVVYPKRTDLDFEGTQIEGEVRNPGEFYFQRRTEEKFDSLVKRRKNFHREMLRDAVLSK